MRERAFSAAFASWTSCPALTSGRRKRFGEVSDPTESIDCDPTVPQPLRMCASSAAFASWKSCPALTSSLRRRPGVREAAGLSAGLASTRSDFASTRSDSHPVDAVESRHPQNKATSPAAASPAAAAAAASPAAASPAAAAPLDTGSERSDDRSLRREFLRSLCVLDTSTEDLCPLREESSPGGAGTASRAAGTTDRGLNVPFSAGCSWSLVVAESREALNVEMSLGWVSPFGSEGGLPHAPLMGSVGFVDMVEIRRACDFASSLAVPAPVRRRSSLNNQSTGFAPMNQHAAPNMGIVTASLDAIMLIRRARSVPESRSVQAAYTLSGTKLCIT